MKEKIFLFSFFLFFFALAHGAFALAAPVRTRLDSATLEKGFTLRSSDYKLKLGIAPGGLSSDRKKIKAFLKQVSSDNYNLTNENLVSNLYAFDFHGARINKPLWLSLKYKKKSKLHERELKFWDNNQQSWRTLPSSDKRKKQRMRGATVLPYAVIGVFAKEKDYQIGLASWYDYSGAASTKYPYGSVVKVINLENNKSCQVTIEDYGPFVDGRVIDLPKEAFSQIADLGAGVISVKVMPIYIP